MSDHFWRDNVIQPALNNDVDDAVAEQKSILAKDPHNAKAYFALGTLSHFQGEIEQAMQYFQKSIELNPADAAPHLSIGRLYAVRGEYQTRLEARPRRRIPGRMRSGGYAGEVSEPSVIPFLAQRRRNGKPSQKSKRKSQKAKVRSPTPISTRQKNRDLRS